jgi:hypothetical protein
VTTLHIALVVFVVVLAVAMLLLLFLLQRSIRPGGPGVRRCPYCGARRLSARRAEIHAVIRDALFRGRDNNPNDRLIPYWTRGWKEAMTAACPWIEPGLADLGFYVQLVELNPTLDKAYRGSRARSCRRPAAARCRARPGAGRGNVGCLLGERRRRKAQ